MTNKEKLIEIINTADDLLFLYGDKSVIDVERLAEHLVENRVTISDRRYFRSPSYYEKEKQLIPLLSMGDKKLDYRKLKNVFVDEFGRGTQLFKSHEFLYIDSRFESHKTYEIVYRLFQPKSYYELLFGQAGLFLKIEKDRTYVSVQAIIESLSDVVEIAKSHIFMPTVVYHFQDGDCYLESEREAKRYGNNFDVLQQGVIE